MKRKIAVLALLALCCALACAPALADSPTDEILNYEITAFVNDDGTVDLSYHIDWKVLRDDIGALEWVTVGIPNSDYVTVEAYSETVKALSLADGSDSVVRIDFERAYHAGETVSFDLHVVQDSMYQMNRFEDGQTSYAFVPGWFDEIAVDALTVRWAAEDAAGWSPDCLVRDGYLEWTTSLEPGETFYVRVDYPNDARSFREDAVVYESDDYSRDGGADYYYEDDDDTGGAVAGLVFLALLIGGPIWLAKKAKNAYNRSASFGGETQKKITRTKVTYYPVCQGCGAPRGEGETVCAHCGRSFVKSEEVIKEENVPAEDREALKYKTKGEYRYSSSPDTYVRVNVVNIPVVHHVSSSGSHSSGSSRGGSSRGGGGCAHSSCACACASCACACACACAGGGRAGCTFKDFYRTDLKLRQLAQQAKR